MATTCHCYIFTSRSHGALKGGPGLPPKFGYFNCRISNWRRPTGLYMLLVSLILWHPDSICQTAQRRSDKSIPQVWSYADPVKFTQTFRPRSPKFYTGSQKVRNSRHQSHLRSSGFEIEQDIGNKKHPSGANTIDLHLTKTARSPIRPLILQGNKKCEIWHKFLLRRSISEKKRYTPDIKNKFGEWWWWPCVIPKLGVVRCPISKKLRRHSRP